jgi:hypothetical protein
MFTVRVSVLPHPSSAAVRSVEVFLEINGEVRVGDSWARTVLATLNSTAQFTNPVTQPAESPIDTLSMGLVPPELLPDSLGLPVRIANLCAKVCLYIRVLTRGGFQFSNRALRVFLFECCLDRQYSNLLKRYEIHVF